MEANGGTAGGDAVPGVDDGAHVSAPPLRQLGAVERCKPVAIHTLRGFATHHTTGHTLAHTPKVMLLCNGGLAVADDCRALPALQHSSLVLGTTTHGAFLETQPLDDADDNSRCV